AKQFQQDTSLLPPVAKIMPDTSYHHQEMIIDDYAWLRQREDTAVINYLEAENTYTRNYMLPWRKTQRQLYYEMVDKVEKNYESLPEKIGDYYYASRLEEDKPYEIYFRSKDSLLNNKETILDVNELAEGLNYYSLLDWQVSPDQRILAFTENLDGGLDNTVRFKNLESQEFLADSLPNIGSMVWANDNKTIFYTQADSSKRDFQVYRHILGTDTQQDELIFQEDNREFNVAIYKSRSRKYIFLEISSKDENEIHLLSNQNPAEGFQLFEKRSKGHQYYLQDYQDGFYVLSNQENPDFALYTSSAQNTRAQDWRPFLNYGSDTIMLGFSIIGDRLITLEKVNLKPYIQIRHLKNDKNHILRVDSSDIFQLGLLSPDEGEEGYLKFAYSSPLEPTRVYSYDFETRQKKLLKARKINNYAPNEYTCHRIFAPARDGRQIPITLVYRKDLDSLATQPRLHLNAYGAYGNSVYLGFRVSNLPFLDRGGIMAYAHVRGGSEFGESWYQEGKLLQKKNTFDDFIACAEYLIAEGYTQKGEIIASGGSAGGLLIGAVMNKRPDLFKVMILDVPFLDVVNTMLDPDLPLTTAEYKEWGNPEETEAYNYMKSYDPYLNIKDQKYPHLLFRSGYYDQQVGFWEAAKTVAKLRRYQLEDQLILYKTDMHAGHQGPSGRYASFKNRSFLDAFLISLFEEESPKISKK
ncbi:MAG: S9 family peptidase, partial [Bacteroidota bacterium]